MASKPARRCPKCKAVVRGQCPTCTKDKMKAYDRWRKTDDDRRRSKKIYDSKQWEIVRTEVFARDEGKCMAPGCGQLVGLIAGDFQCDHIRPLSLCDDPFDMENLQTLCRKCHTAKTLREGC